MACVGARTRRSLATLGDQNVSREQEPSAADIGWAVHRTMELIASGMDKEQANQQATEESVRRATEREAETLRRMYREQAEAKQAIQEGRPTLKSGILGDKLAKWRKKAGV